MIPFHDAVAAAIDSTVASGELADGSLSVYVRDWQDFSSFAARLGLLTAVAVDHDAVVRFIESRDRNGDLPSVGSKHRRRNSVRCLFRCLRRLDLIPASQDPTTDLPLPPRSSLESRPLTDDEVINCQSASRSDLHSTRYPAIWALAESGATMTELCLITRNEVDVDQGLVLLGGGPRTELRKAPLTEWGVRQLRSYLDSTHFAADASLVYGGQASMRRKSTLVGSVRRIFEVAGLLGEPDITTGSIRGWVGQRMRRNGEPIERVALRLGIRSLDNAMALIGEDWRSVED